MEVVLSTYKNTPYDDDICLGYYEYNHSYWGYATRYMSRYKFYKNISSLYHDYDLDDDAIYII